jgi:predicted alpha/beta-fold hydrolase
VVSVVHEEWLDHVSTLLHAAGAQAANLKETESDSLTVGALARAVDATQIPTVPTLVMAKTPFNEMLTESCPILTRKYWPSVWMPYARLQGWIYHLLSTIRQAYEDPAAKWTREKLLTKDNHGITIDKLDDERLTDASHVVLIINSSVSGSHAYETFTYAEQMLGKGFRVYALNQRGAANAQLKTAGDTPVAFNTLSGMGDLRETVNWLAKRHKGRRLTLVSFGTACAMLLNYLNTESKRAPVDSAICISPAMAMESLAELGYLENRYERCSICRSSTYIVNVGLVLDRSVGCSSTGWS